MTPTRRGFFLAGLGQLALAHLADAAPVAHHPAKARRVIQVVLNGGMSQLDTFDYKPEVERRHGQTVDIGLKATATGTPGPLMKSPFKWKQHGQCGRWVTDVFPHLAGCVDDLGFLMALASRSSVHGPASYLQTTGFLLPGFPAAGSWVSYALGRLTDDLPTFVVLPDARGLPYNGSGNFSAGFLPAVHQGTVVRPGGPTPIPDLAAAPGARFVTPDASADGLHLLRAMNDRYAADRPGDSRLSARVEGYELAARMQLAAPEAFDLAREPARLHARYGTDRPAAGGAFARNCLLARRLVERGVRFVQVWSGAGGPSNNWDNHTSIPAELPPVARQVDQPVAALLQDLKARGLWADTVVVFTTEFGRMPVTQGGVGRDHNGGTSVTWLAGAGVKGGTAYGASDDFSHLAAADKTTAHDLYATLLHLLGVDHERLTVRHNGIDRRLTDVHGHVVRAILN
ncbi:DUF1501 domain-containing protein [Urbifossiella limnaea]|uniref:DUF1501 domain-containing protein n=1 Tax=Urbifossiella limnaea TaxID=2528023 RepID=A0A517Y1S2_9BACT|nr:DUF1501 domain-containing protein [Urbifossiella limnaea]QDU23668.1 hypothetical protein ETAA1_56730 [Urbifossiella limnaea]